MTTEKQKQILDKLKDMEELMRVKGYLPIKDAHDFLMMGFSISENFRYMNESRDNWRNKHEEIKKCQRCELCLEHSKNKGVME